MADFQAIGVTSAFAASQSNRHRFHRHHHHHNRHPSQDQGPSGAPSPVARLEDVSRTSSSKKQSPFPVSGADFRVAETTSGRHSSSSEDPSGHLRSEWVTLSKAMLMVLVEKICQLSFENEPVPPAAPPPPGTGSGHRGAPGILPGVPPGVPPIVPRSKDGGADMVDRCRNSHVGAETPSLPSSAIRDPFPGSVASVEESEVDSQLPSLAPFPSCDALRERLSNIPHPPSECSSNSIGIEPSSEGLDGPATSPSSDDSTKQEPNGHLSSLTHKKELTSNSNLKRNLNHSRQKLLLMAGKTGKSGRPGFGGGGGGKKDSAVDDTFRKLKMRSLRQRNADRNVQSWIACNKSLVYSMIDSALGAPDAQQTTWANKSKFVESGTGNSADDGVTEVTTSGADGGKTQQPVAQEPPVCRPKPNCDAPLLGALLNDEDQGSDQAKTPCFRFGRWSKPRPDARHADVTASTASSTEATRRQGDFYSSSFGVSTQSSPRLYEQSQTSGLLLLRQVHRESDRSGIDGPSVETQGGSRSAVDAFGRESARSDGDERSVFVDQGRGGAGVSAPRRKRFGSEGGTQRPRDLLASGDVDPMAHRKPGPLWIALDKSDVFSLVDSLVSRMMMTTTTTNGDVSGQTCRGQTCRGEASPSSAAVSRGNVADRGSHGNDDDDDVPVDFSRARSAADCDDHHGNDDAERGDHGNGCQRKYSMQCLLVEDREKSEDLGSEISKETDNSAILRRNDGNEGSKFNLKWKSNMLLRLHSQSQEDCDNT